jgi:hypothetical protein
MPWLMLLSQSRIANLEPYHYLGETIRTDTQLGASASSAAAVIRVDKLASHGC